MRYLIWLFTCVFGWTLTAQADQMTTPKQEATEESQQTVSTIQFTPPQGWRFADKSGLNKHVQLMVVGQGSKEFPPSLNLSTEQYKGTLRSYLKVVKGINDAQGAQWKDLGVIRTDAGDASLSQVDTKTSWGEVRMMHVILNKDDTVYILTAAALKEEFPKFYKDFFQSMRSLRFNK